MPELKALFEKHELMPLVSMNEKVYPRLVKFFYANMNLKGEKWVIDTQVLGHRIRLDEEDICKLLNIPSHTRKDIQTKVWKYDLDLKDAMLAIFKGETWNPSDERL